MRRGRHPSRPSRVPSRGPAVAAAFLAVAVAASPARAGATGADANFFQLLEQVPFVVLASVESREVRQAKGLVVTRLAVERALKGQWPSPAPAVVQELIFHTDRPLLDVGQRRLLLLEPLPDWSHYREMLEPGSYLRIAHQPLGIADPGAAPLVERYLAALRRPASRDARLAVLVEALRSPQLGDQALRAVRSPALWPPHPTEAETSALAAALRDPSIPPERRRGLLDLVAARRLGSLRPAVRELLGDPRLGPFARRTLAALGEPVTTEAVRHDLASADPAARLAAVESASALQSDERLEILDAMARRDPNLEVRRAAIRALGRGGAAAVPSLAALLGDSDGRIAYYAAQALARIGQLAAVRALSEPFGHGSYESQVAAVFALQKIGSDAALKVLSDVHARPPDPRLRQVIDMARENDVHHH
jgi:hypothetical protein